MLIMLANMQMIVYNPVKVTSALTLISVLYVAATGPQLEARNIGSFHKFRYEPPKLSALRPPFMGGQRSSKYSEEHPIITDEVHTHGPKCPMSSDFHQSDHEQIRATHSNRNDHFTGGSWNFSFGSKMDEFWPMPPQPPPPEIVGKHMEDHHEDSISHEPLMDDKWPHDFVYELINSRFWGEKDASQNPRTHEEEKREHDLKENWRTWMNVISYFPSSREQLERNKNNQNTPPTVDPLTDSMRAQEIKSSYHLSGGEVGSAKRPPDGVQVGGRSSQQVKEQLNAGAGQATTKGLVAQDNEGATTKGLKSGEEINELDQQDPLRRIELPIMMHTHDQIVMGPEENARVASRQSENRQATDEAELPRDRPSTIASTQATTSQRVRDSLLRAADIARNLNSRQLVNNSNSANHNQAIRETVSRTWSVAPAEETSVLSSPENFSAAEAAGAPPTATTRTITSRLNTGMSRRQLEAGFISREPNLSATNGRLDDTFGLDPAKNSSRLTPKFLGFGQIQKDDGNGRTQARLSCQFGYLTQSENITISDVEWARFLGSYETERRPEPGFDCEAEESSCRIVPIKTDTITTIHPRPLIQSYLSTQAAPATYSVTLHEVDDSQYGIYRCSAIRQTTGNDRSMELVYRILNFQ